MPADKLPKKNATRKVPLALKPVPFEEAIADSMKRGVVLPEIYYGQMQGIERAEAFSIAGIAAIDQLQHTLDNLTNALITGETFETWKQGIIAAPDVLDLPAHRLDNIFRTNIQGAYARGHCVHIERNKDRRPILMYSAVDDRARPHHRAMDGHVAPIDDQIWQTWTPPCGYRCRCTVISLTESQAERYRKRDADRLANDPELAIARAAAAANGPDQGWDYSPCGDGSQEKAKIVKTKKPAIAKPLRPKLDQAAEQAQKMRDAEDFTKWTKIEGKKGSNEGGLYQDALGRRWYVKEYTDPLQARSEVAAHILTGKITGAAPGTKLLTSKGRLIYASEWIDDLSSIDVSDWKYLPGQTETALRRQLADHYAAAALLKNWDAVGMAQDNLVFSKKLGRLVMIDAGGALKYRAQGMPKPYTAGPVAELDTLLKEENSASVLFGKLTAKERTAAVQRIKKLKDDDIAAAFFKAGFDHDEAMALTSAAIARKKWMIEATAPTKAATAAKAPATAAKTTKAISAAEAKKRIDALQKDLPNMRLLYEENSRDPFARKAREYGWTDKDAPFFTAIHTYTGSDYSSINPRLWGGGNRAWEDYAAVIRSGIDRLPKYAGTTRRGIKSWNMPDPEAWIETHRLAAAQNKPIEYTGIVSSSSTKAFAGDILIHIEAKGMQGAMVEHITMVKRENEVMFPHRSRFNVLRVEEKKGTTHIWIKEAEEAMTGEAIKLSAPAD